MPTNRGPAEWVLVARFTPTDATPDTDGDWQAIRFPTRQDAEHWLDRDGHDLWWLDAMILPVRRPAGGRRVRTPIPVGGLRHG